jgi:hypothetical protein
MTTVKQDAALLIRCLMHELRISDHIVYADRSLNSDGREVSSSRVLEQLDGAHVGDGSGDAALAIAEEAFRAGCAAFEGKSHWASVDDLWDQFEPSEAMKALS